MFSENPSHTQNASCVGEVQTSIQANEDSACAAILFWEQKWTPRYYGKRRYRRACMLKMFLSQAARPPLTEMTYSYGLV